MKRQPIPSTRFDAPALRHDALQAGDNCDLYMGSWSRQIGSTLSRMARTRRRPRLGRDRVRDGRTHRCHVTLKEPLSLISIDPSEGFLKKRAKMFQMVAASSIDMATRRLCPWLGIAPTSSFRGWFLTSSPTAEGAGRDDDDPSFALRQLKIS